MKISGFTFVRNALKYDYPVVEAIMSILPLCDEMIVAVGQSDDDTLALIEGIDSPKIKIIETIWDDSLREGGQVLAIETNKALAAISDDTDWAFYIQADEVVHERYLPAIAKAMQVYLNDDAVEGLLLKYKHFYGSYRYVGDSARWYRREIRIVRHTGRVASYRDAQGFRTIDNKKLNVRLIDAEVYHYGWVKTPESIKKKVKEFQQFWYDDDEMEIIRAEAETFDNTQVDSLVLFEGTHPAVMAQRIAQMNWIFDFDIRQKNLSFKNKFKLFFERLTGRRIGEYRNYKLI